MWSYLRVGLMLTVLTALLVWLGHFLGGTAGIVIALVFAACLNIGSYWFSDKIVLRATRAQPVTPAQAPELYAMVENLARKADIPTPRLFVVPDPSPNAFATGRNPQHGVVAVNQGLLDMLDRSEVEGVIAHEIGHIRHRDTLTMAIVATVAGAIMAIAMVMRFAAIFGGGSDERGASPLVLLGLAIVAPFAAMMVQMGISRVREYEADRFAAELIGTGTGLQSALRDLHKGNLVRPSRMPESAAHMCIVNPLAGVTKSLFSTHPPVEKRIAALEEVERELRSRN